MTWAKIDDEFYDHPKVLKAGLACVGLFARTLSYCSRKLTDGVVPREAVAAMVGTAEWEPLAIRLVEVGLFDEHPDGYLVHDYLSFNPPASLIKAKRRAAAERMQNNRERSRERKRNAARTTSESNANDARSSQPPVPLLSSSSSGSEETLRNTEEPLEAVSPNGFPARSVASTRARTRVAKPKPENDPRFARFWAAYPKRVEKADALKAWGQLDPDDALVERMLVALALQSQSGAWRNEGGKYVPNPPTWLRGKRWEDEVRGTVAAPRPTAPAIARTMTPAEHAAWREKSERMVADAQAALAAAKVQRHA